MFDFDEEVDRAFYRVIRSCSSPPKEEMPTRCLPGKLSVLPPEVIWKIVDLIFTDNYFPSYIWLNEVAHDNICTLDKLRRTHEDVAVYVDAYLSRETAIQWIQESFKCDASTYASARDEAFRDGDREFVHWHRSSHYCSLANFPGLVRRIIIDDCPSCFMLLQKFMPELKIDGNWVNKDGWRFIALAAFSESWKIIEHFCSIESSNGRSCIPLFAGHTSIHSPSEPVLQKLLVQKPDAQFIRQLFTFLIPLLRELNHPGGYETKAELLNPKVRFLLCKFLTVQQAIELEKCGMPLYCDSYDIEEGQKVNPYYAAAANGAEFLEYIHQNRLFSLYDENFLGEPLITRAVDANSLSSVIWLQAHGIDEKYTEEVTNSINTWRKTATWSAASSPSEESVEILKRLLSPIDANQFSSMFCPLLLKTVVEGVRYRFGRDIDGPKSTYKSICEARAIQKCQFIISKFRKDFCGSNEVKEAWEYPISRATQELYGLFDLAACIKAAMPHD